MAQVYLHRRLDNNEVFYVGIALDDKGRRANDTVRRNQHWLRVYSKYGREVEIIHTDIDYEEAKAIEVSLINKYGRSDKRTGTLVNMTDGGDGTTGRVISMELRDKISKAQSGLQRTDAQKEHLRIINTGKKHSQETKDKVGLASLNRTHSDETKSKISSWQKGRIMNPEWVESMRKAKTGKATVNTIRLYDTVTGDSYETIACAAKALNMSKRTLSEWITTKPHNNKTNLVRATIC